MKTKIFKIRIQDEFLRNDQKNLDKFLAQFQILKTETAFVPEENYWSVLLFYDQNLPIVKEGKPQKYSAQDDVLNVDEIKLLDALKLWRSEKAKDQKLPTYFIATNQELISLVKYKPLQKEELMDIKGFGKHKIENYGEEILEILESI